MRILGRFFVAAVFLMFAAGAIFGYAHTGQYGEELIGLWFFAALGSLFWIFKKETEEEKETARARGKGFTSREKILFAIVGVMMLIVMAFNYWYQRNVASNLKVVLTDSQRHASANDGAGPRRLLPG